MNNTMHILQYIQHLHITAEKNTHNDTRKISVREAAVTTTTKNDLVLIREYIINEGNSERSLLPTTESNRLCLILCYTIPEILLSMVFYHEPKKISHATLRRYQWHS